MFIPVQIILSTCSLWRFKNLEIRKVYLDFQGIEKFPTIILCFYRQFFLLFLLHAIVNIFPRMLLCFRCWILNKLECTVGKLKYVLFLWLLIFSAQIRKLSCHQICKKYVIYMKLHRSSLTRFSVGWRQDYHKMIHKGSITHGGKKKKKAYH